MSERETELLIESFDQLHAILKQFRSRLLLDLNKNTDPHRIFSDSSEPTSINKIADTLTNIWFLKKGDGRCTENLYGLIGVSPELIPILHQLNNAKSHFQQSVKKYRDHYGNPLSVLHKRAENLNEDLQAAGLARLHLKQCYRQLPVLDSTPDKIQFSWYTSGRSIKKLSTKEAESRLLKMDISQLHIQLQLEALSKIPTSESLAQLQTQVPVMRANIMWKRNEEIIRKARNAPLPIFFPLDDKQSFPEYNTPSLAPPETRQRQQRSDQRIDPEPYLPSLRIHRYREND